MTVGRPVTIGVAARRIGQPEWKLRAWEHAGLLSPERSPSGYRLYSPSDIERARRIAAELDGDDRLALVGLEHAGPAALVAHPLEAAEAQGRTAVSEHLIAERELRILRRLANAVRHSERSSEVLEVALEGALEATGAYIGALSSADFTTQRYRMLASVGLSDAYLHGVDSWRLHEGLAGRSFGMREPLLVEDLQSARHVARDVVREEGLRAYVCVPLLRGPRRLGIIEVFGRTPGRFGRDDVAMLELIAAAVAPALEAADLERHVTSLQEERSRSFREWASQLAALSDSERRKEADRLRTLADSWLGRNATVEQAAADVRAAAEAMARPASAHIDLVPLVRGNIADRLTRLHHVDVRLELREWPASLPSALSSRLYMILLALAESAASAAKSAVIITLDSAEHLLTVTVADDRDLAGRTIRVVPASSEIIESVRNLGGGIELASSPDLPVAIRIVVPHRGESGGETLTVRERSVLEGLRAGLSNRELAIELGISPKTLQNHLTTLYRKLNVASRAEAIRYADQSGIPDPDAR